MAKKQTQTATNDTVTNPLNDGDVAAAAPVRAAFVPRVVKILTLPLLKLQENVPAYIKFTAPTFIGKEINEEGGTKKKEPPIMANVVDLTTGEMVQIMLGTVLQGILSDDYPDNSYVGRGFEIVIGEKKRSKHGGTYNTYRVAEIEVD